MELNKLDPTIDSPLVPEEEEEEEALVAPVVPEATPPIPNWLPIAPPSEEPHPFQDPEDIDAEGPSIPLPKHMPSAEGRGLPSPLDPSNNRTDSNFYGDDRTFPTEAQEDVSYFEDAARGVAYGGLGFIESILDLGTDVANSTIKLAEATGLNAKGGFRFGEIDLNDQFKPRTWLGDIIGGITQIAMAYAAIVGTGGAAGALLGGTRLGAYAAGSRAGQFVKWASNKDTAGAGFFTWQKFRRGMSIGAVADLIAFKEHEQRLSNFMTEVPLLNNAVTRYLAADESDAWLEGRMKNVLEGMGIGMVAEVLLIPILKGGRGVNDLIAKGKYEKAAKLAGTNAEDFRLLHSKVIEGRAVLHLHDENIFRQYLTLVPGMNPAKMQVTMQIMRTLAKTGKFEDLNQFLQQGLNEATLNMPLPRGAFTLPEFDPNRFWDKADLAKGREGPMGDGTPYTLISSQDMPNIEEVAKTLNLPKGYAVHTRQAADGSEYDVFVFPGMLSDQAKQIARDNGQDIAVTSEGIHYLSGEYEGKIRQRTGIHVLDNNETVKEGENVFFLKGTEEEFEYVTRPGGVGFDRKSIGTVDSDYWRIDYDPVAVPEPFHPLDGNRSYLAQRGGIPDEGKGHPSVRPASKGGVNVESMKDKDGNITPGQEEILAKAGVQTGYGPATALEHKTTLDELMHFFNSVKFNNMEDMVAFLGKAPPEYLDKMSKFIRFQREKLMNGELTVRDTIKATLLTAASQQTGGASWATVVGRIRAGAVGNPMYYRETKGVKLSSALNTSKMLSQAKHGLKLEGNTSADALDKIVLFTDWVEDTSNLGGNKYLNQSFFSDSVSSKAAQDKIRPEDLASLWLMSPTGKVALDALSNHNVYLGELWEELVQVRAAAGGREAFRRLNILPAWMREAGPEPISSVPAYRNVKGDKAHKSLQGGITDLQGITDQVNNHMKQFGEDYDTKVLGKIIRDIKGVQRRKEGFLKHYIGVGDTFTMDSVQQRFLITGQLRGQRAIKGEIKRLEDLNRALKVHFQGNQYERDLIQRLQDQNQTLLDHIKANIPSDGTILPDDVIRLKNMDAHILHQWMWDKIQGYTGHSDIDNTAMVLAQLSENRAIRGATSFGEEGQQGIHLITRSFFDKYGRKYEPSDFTTVIHEIGHLFRKNMPKEQLRALEKSLGIKNGVWSRHMEEKFAREFEKWLTDAGTSLEGLNPHFGKMKDWMEELYRNVHNSPMKLSIQPDTKQLFDQVFGKGGTPVFLTGKDRLALRAVIDAGIAKGDPVERIVDEIGMNMRAWDDGTEVEDVMQAVGKFIEEEKLMDRFGPKQGPSTISVETRRSTRKPGDVLTNEETLAAAKEELAQQTNTQLDDIANIMGVENSLVHKHLKNIADQTQDLPMHMIKAKILMATYAKSIYAMAHKAVAGGSDADVAKLHLAIDKLADVYTSVLRINRGAARTVQAGNIKVAGLDPSIMEDIIRSKGGKEQSLKIARDIIAAGNPANNMVSLKALRMMSKSKLAWDMVHEFRINGLLSSMKSLTIDVVSTGIHLLLLPAERIAGGVVTANMQSIKDGAGLYYGYANAIRESLAIAHKVMKTEIPQLDPTIRHTETAQHAITTERIGQVFPGFGKKKGGDVYMNAERGEMRSYGFDKPRSDLGNAARSLFVSDDMNNALGNTIDFIGRRFVRWPSWLRMVSKEFYDQISFRAKWREILLKQAMDKFDVKTQKDLIAQYVVDNFEAGFDKMGRGINDEAMQYAREVNFAEPLVDGFAATVNAAKNKHPSVALIMPFVRTPAWLFRGFIGRSLAPLTFIPGIGELVAALNPALRTIRDDWLAGGVRRANAVGKASTALTLYGSAVILANDGIKIEGLGQVRLIGTGPPDSNQRRIMETGGWLAESFEIEAEDGTKKYISIDRGDPWQMFLIAAADYVQLSDHLTDDQRQDIVGFMVMAMVNVLDGAYMKGALDAAGAWSQGGGKAEYFMTNMVKSFVPRIASQNPLSSIPGMEFLNDNYRRKTEGIMSAWQAAFPGLWNYFGVEHNTITGKPVEQHESWKPGGFRALEHFSPFKYSEAVPDEENPMLKISELLYGAGGPSTDKFDVDLRNIKIDERDPNGIKLNNAYQKYNNYIGRLDVEGILKKITENDQWSHMPTEMQKSVFRRVMRLIRNQAWKNLMTEDPELRAEMIQARYEQLSKRIPIVRSNKQE